MTWYSYCSSCVTLLLLPPPEVTSVVTRLSRFCSNGGRSSVDISFDFSSYIFALSFCPLLFGVLCSGFVRRCRPPSMPACVAPRGSSHSLKGSLVLLCINVFFWLFGIFFTFGRGSFLLLSAPRHIGSPPGHHDARLGPGRGPWHVLWGFKVAGTRGE